jgi:hypothetical protein
MKGYVILLITVSVFLFSACNTLKITTHKDEAVDFSKFKTISFYGWTERSGEVINELDKKNIEKAFAKEFRKRGLEFVKQGGDLTVSLYIHIEEGTNTVAYMNHYNMYGYSYSYDPMWTWGVGTLNPTTRDYDYYKGTLVVDVFDNTERKLIWQSVGSKKLKETGDAREKNTPKAIASMMKSFPKKSVKD